MRVPGLGAGAAALAALLACVAAPLGAHAHVVMGSRTLRALTADATLVVRGAVEAAAPTAAPEAGRPVAELRVHEVLKASGPAAAPGAGGPRAGETLRFAQHGHGEAELAPGEEVLLFLKPIAAVPELRALAARPGAPAWVSIQEHEEKWALEGGADALAAAAVRAYAAALAEPDPAARREALRRITLALLASPDPRLAASALRDVVLAGEALLGPADTPALLDRVESPAVPMGVRLGLLAELDRRGALEDAPARWVALLEGARGPERVAVIRALGAHPSPPVTAALVAELEGEDAAAAEAAAVALGVPGLAAAVPPLAAALADGSSRLRMAAIRGLGRVGTAGAREALAEAADHHPDPATRRRAEAELRRLAAAAAGGASAGDPAARIAPAPPPDPQPAPSAPTPP